MSSRQADKARWNKKKAERRQKAVERRAKRLEGTGKGKGSKALLGASEGVSGRTGKKVRVKKTVEQARKTRSLRRKPVKRPKKTTYKGYVMDSGAELAFAKLLDQFGVKWEKNTTKKFPYKTAKGYIRKYIPDFYLEEYDEWVEIKGRYYQTSNLKAQLEAVGPNIQLIYSDELRLPDCCAHLRVEEGLST